MQVRVAIDTGRMAVTVGWALLLVLECIAQTAPGVLSHRSPG